MKTVTLDDESLAVSSLLRQLKKIDPNGSHEGFVKLEDLMDYIHGHRVDIAFVDIDLTSALNGIDLTRHLSESYPDMNIIIYSGHAEPEYKAEALELYVSGYLVKPVTEEELRQALTKLRVPVKELRVQCFGHFEVFFGGEAVRFDRKYSKEVFAYLIDKRGAEVPEEELRGIVWSDSEGGDEKRSYIRNIIYDIRKTLVKCGVPKEFITTSKGHYGIDRSMISCDYYDYLDGKDVRAAKLGQYMEQYDWAAPVRERLFG